MERSMVLRGMAAAAAAARVALLRRAAMVACQVRRDSLGDCWEPHRVAVVGVVLQNGELAARVVLPTVLAIHRRLLLTEAEAEALEERIQPMLMGRLAVRAEAES